MCFDVNSEIMTQNCLKSAMLSGTIAPQNQRKQLDLIHHETVRIITGGTKLCSIQKLLSELGWETLQERRSKHRLVIFYKIINRLTPDSLSDLLPHIIHHSHLE